MARAAKRVKLEPNTDLTALVEEMRADHAPRVLEKDGEDVAVILSTEDYADFEAEPKSKRHKEKLLTLAGAWSDINAEELIETIYRNRHELPPSPPITL